MGDFSPVGRIRSSLTGDGPQGKGDLALRGFLAPRGGFGPRSQGMALRGGPLPIYPSLSCMQSMLHWSTSSPTPLSHKLLLCHLLSLVGTLIIKCVVYYYYRTVLIGSFHHVIVPFVNEVTYFRH